MAPSAQTTSSPPSSAPQVSSPSSGGGGVSSRRLRWLMVVPLVCFVLLASLFAATSTSSPPTPSLTLTDTSGTSPTSSSMRHADVGEGSRIEDERLPSSKSGSGPHRRDQFEKSNLTNGSTNDLPTPSSALLSQPSLPDDAPAALDNPTLPLSGEALLAFVRSKGVTSNINPCTWEWFEQDYQTQRRLLRRREEEERARRRQGRDEEGGAQYTFYSPKPITMEEMLQPIPALKEGGGVVMKPPLVDPNLIIPGGNATARSLAIPIYMIHYTPMTARRAEMARMLAQHGVFPEWVLGFDKEAILLHQKRNTAEASASSSVIDPIKCFFTFDASDFAADSLVLDRFVHGHNASSSLSSSSSSSLSSSSTPLVKPLSVVVPDPANRKQYRHDKRHNPVRGWTPPILKGGQQSVVTKHHSALYRVLRNNDPMAVILEDDAFLRNNFKQRLGEILTEISGAAVSAKGDGNHSSSDSSAAAVVDAVKGHLAQHQHWDVLWIGGCMKMRGWRRKFETTFVTRHLYGKQEARCAHAYVVSQAGAAKLLNGMPFTLPIDFQYSAAMREGNARSYWVEPWLSIQGDMGGCVTNTDLGAQCVSVEKGYDPAFDIKKVNEYDAGWERIPPFKSKR